MIPTVPAPLVPRSQGLLDLVDCSQPEWALYIHRPGCAFAPLPLTNHRCGGRAVNAALACVRRPVATLMERLDAKGTCRSKQSIIDHLSLRGYIMVDEQASEALRWTSAWDDARRAPQLGLITHER